MTPIQVKRLLALLKAKAEKPEKEIIFEVPEGFKESFENQKNFRGWINYHVTWDVTREDPWVVRLRTISLVAEWHRELIKLVPVISPTGEIMEAEEWEKRSHSTQRQES